MLSNSTSYFFKTDSSSGCNEGKCYVVDRLSRLQEDVCSKLIIINNVRSIIRGIADNRESIKTSLCLNIAKIWFNNISKVCSRQLIIEFKELCFCCSLQCLLNCEEQAANVDSIKCRCISESSLITERGVFLRPGVRDEGVNSRRVETISLCFIWIICKFNCIVDNTTLLTSR